MSGREKRKLQSANQSIAVSGERDGQRERERRSVRKEGRRKAKEHRRVNTFIILRQQMQANTVGKGTHIYTTAVNSRGK